MKKRYTKILSLALALVMMFSLCPATAFAVPSEGIGKWFRGGDTAMKDWEP